MSEASSWSRERIAELGPVTDVPTAASVLGVSDWTLYEMIRRRKWDQTRVLRLGRQIRIPTEDLIALLYPSVSSATTERPSLEPLTAMG